jgi:hypothetical protein
LVHRFGRAEQRVGHRRADPALEPVPAPTAPVHRSVGDVRRGERPQDVGGVADVEPGSQAEPVGDVPGQPPGAGGPLVLDRRVSRPARADPSWSVLYQVGALAPLPVESPIPAQMPAQ